MYLTQIRIDPHKRAARKYLASPQTMHAAVMAACEKGSDTDDGSEKNSKNRGRVLWRVDEGSYGTLLYVTSPKRPDMGILVRDVGLGDSGSRTAPYDNFISKLEIGQTWAFRLTVNPARAVKQPGLARGKRYGHVTAEQQIQWLLQRADANGFEILSSSTDGDSGEVALQLIKRERPMFNRMDADGKKKRVTINHATFEGALRVVDADAFRSLLVNGIGPSKAYGCGLMTLAKVK